MAIHGKKSLRAISDGMANKTPFKAAAMSGDWVTSTPAFGWGQLPVEWYAHIDHDMTVASRGAYIVYSYTTPIAWWTSFGGWTVPDVRYSVTTSGHQGIVRVNASSPGFSRLLTGSVE